MPRVQYSNPAKGVNSCKWMPTPKLVSKLSDWLKKAYKLHPEAPRDYTLRHSIVTERSICLEFISSAHEKFAFAIDRRG